MAQAFFEGRRHTEPAERRSLARIDLGTIGAVPGPGDEGFVEAAVELERLGFETIWLAGGPMATLGQIADVVRATESVRVASRVLVTPEYTARARATVGDGSRDQPVVWSLGNVKLPSHLP